MTDKEQIIIDIDRCKYRDKYTNFCLAEKDDIGETYTICTGTDCYFKQLARKTQECEDLKEQLQAEQPTGICETCMATALLQNDRYCKALKEIEKVCLEDTHTFADGTVLRYDTLDDILSIINKLIGG